MRSFPLTRSPFSPFTTRRCLTTLGLRREDPSRIWERRTPLTPQAVQNLLADAKDELRVEVESCKRRCFSDALYSDAGAKIVSSLSKDVDVVLGIKEPRLADIRYLVEASKNEGKKRTWMMFSHTHKGQEYNIPLLSTFLHPTQTLIDHELLTAPVPGKDDEPQLKRVAAFGWFAGAVGTGEALSLTGLALLRRGLATPLLSLSRPYSFGSLAAFKEALKKAGEQVQSSADLKGHEPIVIGVTGAGHVSSGAKEMLNELGVVWVAPEELAELRQSGSPNKIYACAITAASYLQRIEGGIFDREEYYKSPDKYMSIFAAKIAPHLTTLINGVGWSKGFPRAITSSSLNKLIEKENGKQKLVAVQDIACDKEGGLEFVDQFTTIDNPYFEGPGDILISAIDILPTELAADASTYFSSALYPYIQGLLFPSSQGDKGDIADTLSRAAIIKDGILQPQHEWLGGKIEQWKTGGAAAPDSLKQERLRKGGKKKVLLLGSGLVAGPAVDVFAARPDVHLIIASNNLAEAQSHIRGRPNVEAVALDVADDAKMSEYVEEADIVVSLLPAPMHPRVAKHCLDHSRHLVTASYNSPELQALHSQAVEKDVIFLGECGLDPGIDSMAAMRILERVKREGKQVKSFVSWCGGLPELSASKGPLRYKFSWSPKAVLTAAQNDASFKLDGKHVKIPGNELLARRFPEVKLWEGLPLEGLANRDSMPYAKKYGLGPAEGLTDLFRGTLRYQGFSSLLNSFRLLGLLRSDPLPGSPKSWTEFFTMTVERELGLNKALKGEDVNSAVQDLVGEGSKDVLRALKLFSLFPGTDTSLLPLPKLPTPSPIDLFAHLLSRKLAYLPDERDTCLLHHSFTISTPSSNTQQVTASLRHIASPTQSSMSITVGKTLAFAALRVADGEVKVRGVTGPYEREVWTGVLSSLEGEGVVIEEKWN
ncbi:alpha-aminoadipic semialdehyde synthase [Cryptococcus deuterogattii 99/473]|uniref:Alpha-aminoadipic semialdehyde synthase n=1 Tax=Cryptococcus deuterogattii Ram5 TaxID=1296110 RepID=A0A0D0V6U7_9TREE|nr:alpha-aminoadipic semialdehyde synthase [Cryptococcus deuterogattii Ram5]KIS01194.1 alpha-aminoadipic semialdehyde synthase [Cryptococcus deuterogattii 2001/935-1]KIY58280.1 alpha-aminoadipic semialdehyde synthase [Cryptococcus deuterogattii 99/473]